MAVQNWNAVPSVEWAERRAGVRPDPADDADEWPTRHRGRRDG
jgi:hypothetical protein